MTPSLEPSGQNGIQSNGTDRSEDNSAEPDQTAFRSVLFPIPIASVGCIKQGTE